MLFTALIFFLILSILVFVHELGHYTVARLIGVHVEEFGFGLPPRIWGKKIHGTIYSINWLPIGGFVKLAGEDETADTAKAGKGKKSKNLGQFFWARSKKERAAILLAGVTMNFLLAVVLTTYLLTQGVFEPVPYTFAETVMSGSPAQTAGIRVNDVVKSVLFTVSGKEQTKIIRTPQDLIDVTHAHEGETITVTVDRSGKILAFSLIPRKTFPKGEGPMGVAITNVKLTKYPLSVAPFQAVKLNLQRAVDMFTSLGGMVWKLAHLKSPGADVAGPIGIAQVTGQAVKFGLNAVLEFMSILSLNLAVLNVLPIPALDGGRLLFVILEKVFGRKVHPAFEQWTHQIGMIILLLLVVLISINDILRLAHGG